MWKIPMDNYLNPASHAGCQGLSWNVSQCTTVQLANNVIGGQRNEKGITLDVSFDHNYDGHHSASAGNYYT